jgi:predicted nucleic acid-binding protein
MRAVDTNVLVRYLTNDDPDQSARAGRLVTGEAVFVPLTVLLETEWVLRSVYGFAPGDVINALRGFAGLPTVALENPATAARALEWAERGMDFADALHLASAQPHDGFVSFDKALARAARRAGALPVTAL